MAEYIDRENYCKNICRCSREKCDKEKCPIWTAPAADVREVVRGKWEWFDEECGTPIDGQDREWGWRCSVCKDTL